MKHSIDETFTADLHYEAERISLEDIENEVAEEVKTSNYYNEEELQAIWDALRKIYELNDEHFIVMYLMYYLGFSYRKIAAVIGRGPSLVFLYNKQAIKAIQNALGVESVDTAVDEESVITSVPESEGI